jgi:hypothetical protein
MIGLSSKVRVGLAAMVAAATLVGFSATTPGTAEAAKCYEKYIGRAGLRGGHLLPGQPGYLEELHVRVERVRLLRRVGGHGELQPPAGGLQPQERADGDHLLQLPWEQLRADLLERCPFPGVRERLRPSPAPVRGFRGGQFQYPARSVQTWSRSPTHVIPNRSKLASGGKDLTLRCRLA